MTAESKPTADNVAVKRDSKGLVYPSLSNVYAILRDHHDWQKRLAFNELRDCEEYWPSKEFDPLGYEKERRVDDLVVTHTRLWLERAIAWKSPPSRDHVVDAMDAAARAHTYHPVRNYLAVLPNKWDGRPRLDTWLQVYAGAPDDAFTRAAGRKTLIAAAARAFLPGCKHDSMLILVGPQGGRKSTLVRILGRQWTTDTPFSIGGKDGYETIREGWIVEVPELAGMTGKDVERLKAFFSSPCDVYRPPYGRKVIRRNRACAFIGTTNDSDFLHDVTGSRRFWCVQVGDIDDRKLEADIDQIWGEATQRFLEGKAWHLTAEEEAQGAAFARSYEASDPWLDVIERQLVTWPHQRIHAARLYEWLGVPAERQHKGTHQRLTRIMVHRLSFPRLANPFELNGERGRGFSLLKGDKYGVNARVT